MLMQNMVPPSLPPKTQSTRIISVLSSLSSNLDLTLSYDGKSVVKQVPPSMRVSALRALIARTFGISIRKRRIMLQEGEAAPVEVGEGDGAREVNWLISGRKGDVIIS